MGSVTHLSEEFRDYLFWTDLPENAQRYWVGSATPRLTSPDGDTTYGHVEPGSGALTTVTVTLAPFALTDNTTVTMQVRTLSAAADTFELFFADYYGSNYIYLDVSAGTSWQTVSGLVSDFDGWGDVRDDLITVAAAGELVAGVLGPLGVGTGYGVSWIDVQTGGLRPLQHRQRTDAYGVGGVQAARTRTTFQSSLGARRPV